MTEILIRDDGTNLPCELLRAPATGKQGPGLVCFHGYKSDRGATKLACLKALCVREGWAFAAPDFYAHGESGGAWSDFTIGRAVDDALRVFDECTQGPQILMGSSMGGWVALRLMEARRERVAGLVLVAPAPDFTIWIERDRSPRDYERQGYTRRFIEQGRSETVMDKPWRFSGPVHILQGQADEDVPWRTATAIREHFVDPGAVVLTLVPDGDHRLNRPADLELLKSAVFDVKSRI